MKNGVAKMETHELCQMLELASNDCCGITLCPQCQVIHLRIGPVSLKLPPHAFHAVCEAVHEAQGRARKYLPTLGPPAAGCKDTRH
jgi:hypothetical protein